jgi:hypothetical protein
MLGVNCCQQGIPRKGGDFSTSDLTIFYTNRRGNEGHALEITRSTAIREQWLETRKADKYSQITSGRLAKRVRRDDCALVRAIAFRLSNVPA